MKPGIPWSVKGIEQQAREAAKQAARQSGMTIGEWLNSVILESADGDDIERRYRRPPYRMKPLPGAEDGESEEVTLRLEEIAEQLHTLARHESETALSRHASSEDENQLRAIVERLDAHEQRTSGILDAMQEQLDELARRPVQDLHMTPQGPDDVPAYRALEGALRYVIEHIEVSETRTRDSIKALQDQLRDGSGAAGGDLEQRVAELAERMAVTAAAKPNDLMEVREAGQRLRALVEDARQAAGSLTAGMGASQGDIDQLRLEIEQLAATVSQASGHAVTDLGERVQRLETDLKRQLADRDEETRREVSALGRRLAETERRLEHLATIEDSVAQLARSLEEDRGAGSHRGAGASRELKALEDGLNAVRASAEMSDRRTQETLQAVHDTLEHIIGKLTELEAGDEAGEETAEAPITEAAEERSREPAEEAAGQPVSSLATEPEAEAASDEPEGDSAETETAMVEHETAMVEHEPAMVEPEPAMVEPEPDDFIPVGVQAESMASAEEGPTGENEPDSRDEPELAAGETTPVTDYAAPSAAADQPVREDYIAAARRAAQMASRRRNPVTSGFNKFSQRMSGTGSQTADPAEGSARKRGFVSSLFAGLRGRKAGVTGDAQPDSKESRRKLLILAGLVVLAAASAYGAQRHAASNPGFDLLGDVFTGTEEAAVEEASATPAATARDALTTASVTRTADLADRSRPVALSLPAGIGPDALRQAAIGGDARAQFVVAGRYLEGTAVPRDEEKAAEWYSLAASQGLAAAQYRLGSMYEHGRGRALDHELARQWYERAAGSGNINAMHNLAVLYIEPRDGKRQYQLAATWFRRAAERGLKDSQFNLAVLNERGLGMAKNPQEAIFWYSLAAVQGDREAAVKAKAIEATLAPDLAEQVHARLLSWRPLPVDRDANVVPPADPSWHGTS